MKYLVSAMLVVVGVIHLLPLSGVLGSERLASLYGLEFNEPNLAILMRHRAVLFGLLGAFMVFAAFKPAYQTVAYIGGFISVVSFLCLAWSVGGYNEQVGRVFVAMFWPSVASLSEVWCERFSNERHTGDKRSEAMYRNLLDKVLSRDNGIAAAMNL